MRHVVVIGCLDKLLWQVSCIGLVHGWCTCSWYRLRYMLVHGWRTCSWYRLRYMLVHGWCTYLWYKFIAGFWVQVGAWLMHLFMVYVDYRLRYRLMHGWCMVRLIGTGCLVQVHWYGFTVVYLTVIVWQWFHHSTYTSGWLDGARTGGCIHLPVVAGEHRGL